MRSPDIVRVTLRRGDDPPVMLEAELRGQHAIARILLRVHEIVSAWRRQSFERFEARVRLGVPDGKATDGAQR